MKNSSFRLAVFAALTIAISSDATATTFTISGASTTAQTLGSGAGQTGTVTNSGSLTVSGSTVAVTISGNTATLTNLGTIKQTGSGRVIRDNTGVTGLVINNGSSTNSTALLQAANADVIQMNVSPASVTLNNYGTMTSLNSSAGGAQAVDFTAILSGSNVVNNFSTGIMQASEADAVRPGVGGIVSNAGLIKATTSTGSSSDGIDAQNSSGVQITNEATGLVEGARHGITGQALDNTVNFAMSVTNKAGGVVQGDNGSGINVDGFNNKELVTIVNNGTITGNGVTGDGDGLDVDGLVNVTNTGIIRSINAFSTAEVANSEGLSVGGGTITNSGTIEGLVAAGNTNAVGRGISLLGNDITAGPLAGTREAIYGNATVTNQTGGLIRGQTDSGIAVGGPASGFTVSITNQTGATIRGGGATTAAILTGADNDAVNNAGTIDGSSSGNAISLGAGDDTVNITGNTASITGGIDGGTGTDTLNFDLGTAANTFSYGGSISNFEAVKFLSGVTILSGNSNYAGTTQVGGGSAAARLVQTGNHSGGGNITVQTTASYASSGTETFSSATKTLTIDNGGEFSPGTETPGRFTLALGSVVDNGTLAFSLQGSLAGDDYDQFRMGLANPGTFILGSTSVLSLSVGFIPLEGTVFTLIDLANSESSVGGTFSGLAEGAQFTASGQKFRISYIGGTGNDVTATAVPEAGTWASFLGAGWLGWIIRRRKTA